MRITNWFRPLRILVKDRRIIGNMLKDMMRRRYKPSALNVFLLISGLLYIVFPMDIVPDFIPIAGWIDDGMIMLFLSRRVLAETNRYHNYSERIGRRSGNAVPESMIRL